MSAVAKIDPHVPATRSPTPMDLLTQAVASGNLELAEKLMGLQERWERNQARKAFDNAMAEAKSEMPIIIKDQTVDFSSQKGRTNYKYEDMAGLARQVDPILSKHGLSYRYRTSSDKESMTVTCIVSHRDGHSEENSLTAPNDLSGNKNAIQAIGSTQTYLQRYTLKAALGLAASKDDDAKSADVELISDEQAEEIKKLAETIGPKIGTVEGLYKGFFKKFKVEKIGDIPAKEYKNAIAALKGKDPKND
jgi:hypothetical protein